MLQNRKTLNAVLHYGWFAAACAAVLLVAAPGCQPSVNKRKAQAKAEAALARDKAEMEKAALAANTTTAAGEEKPAEKPAEGSTGDKEKPAEKETEKETEKKPAAKVTLDAVVDSAEKFQEGAEKAAPAETECRWATSPIKIDGDGDEAAWQGAPSIENFIIPWLKGDDVRPPRTGTKAKVLWDKEYFYFFADMEDADLYADVTEHDGLTWENDVFEIFFKPSKEKPNYYEFQVNAAGTELDMHLPRRNAGGYPRFKNTQEFHIDSKVKLRGTLNKWEDEDRGWSVEGRIPWTDFAAGGGGPKVDDVWNFALCRYDYTVAFEGPELSTTAPLQVVNFHHWEDYTPLRFLGPEKTSQVWPHALEKRVAFTTSKVIGSPEPPHPYRAKPAFPNLNVKQPLFVYAEPGTDQLLVLQHLGIWAGPSKVIRVPDDPQTSKSEDLLSLPYLAYGIAFHPNYKENGYLYVGMNGPVSSATKMNRIKRFTVDRKPPYAIDPKSELVIIEWASDGHNGADLGFGPDGMLYISSGDGTSDSDTNLTGQDITELLSAVLRIDVDHPDEGRPYSVPKDNPFIGVKDDQGRDARPEQWAYGFRNPWRMTFDPKTGHLWVGQNGQDLWEQVIKVERGANYGWSVMEGSHPFYLERKRGPTPISPPTIDHPHSEARSLTGGVVYHGTKLPELAGAYIYGDWSTGKIWAVKHDGTKITFHKEIADTTLQIGGFGLDHAGELFVVDQGGGKAVGDALYRLEPTPEEAKLAKFPKKLTETGLFKDVAALAPEAGVISYSVNAPQWHDGATAERYMALPGNAQIAFPSWRGLALPEGSVLVKTLSMEMEAGKPESRRRIETQLLTKQQNEWAAYTYEWNDDQSDATLVDRNGKETVLTIKDAAAPGGERQHPWQFAVRTDCMGCHSRAANYVLGITELQLNKTHNYGNVSENQLRALSHAGYFTINWLEHENEIYGRLAGWVQWPVTSAMQLVNHLEKKYANAKPKPKLDASGQPPKLAWNFPGDATYFLPAPVEYARRKVVKYRTELRNELTAAQRFTSKLPKAPERYLRLVNPYDEKADLDARARSYIHANCSQCHVAAGGGNAMMELEFVTERDKTNLYDAVPQHGTFGMTGGKLVASGDPFRSVLLYRISKLGGGRMPRGGSNVVDEAGVKMIREWITKLPPEKTADPDAAFTKQQFAQQREAEQALLATVRSQATEEAARNEALDKLLASTSGSMMLLAAIDQGEVDAKLREMVVARAGEAPELAVRDLFERFVPLAQRVKRLGPNVDPAALLAVQGSVDRGRDLFFNVSTVQCKNCHRIGDGKEQMGPDLTEIGKKYTREQLLESILEPSKKVEPKYQGFQFLLADGRAVSGLVTSKADGVVTLKDSQNKELKLSEDDIEDMAPSPKSIMPDAQFRDLTAQQAADMLAYLASLKPAGEAGAVTTTQANADAKPAGE